MAMPVSFEGQDRVYHMLKDARSCDGAILGDVPNDEHRHLKFTCDLSDSTGCCTHL